MAHFSFQFLYPTPFSFLFEQSLVLASEAPKPPAPKPLTLTPNLPDKDHDTGSHKLPDAKQVATGSARPVTGDLPSQQTNSIIIPRAERSDTRLIPGLAIRGAQNASSAGPSTVLHKRELAVNEPPRSHKKAKRNDSNADNTPSLLSRLGATNGSAAASSIPAKRRQDNSQAAVILPRHDSMDLDAIPVGGFSIRGAANRTQESIPPVSRSSSSSSLLDRMKGVDIAPGDRGGWKRRNNRGRP